jgi:hypothetical protein
LHPRPTEWEDLETWVRRIAKIYGVSYDAFLLNALPHQQFSMRTSRSLSRGGVRLWGAGPPMGESQTPHPSDNPRPVLD